MEFHLPLVHVLVFVVRSSLFTFFLDKKSNKKIKANPNAPLDLPLLTHKLQNCSFRSGSV